MKKFLSLALVFLCSSLIGLAQDTWTVAGSSAAVNGTTDWAPANEDNDMVSEDGVVFTLTVDNCTLEKGVVYKYKVVKNHTWDEAYPTADKSFSVDETAQYTVVYTFNADTKEVGEVATKTAEAGTVTHIYSVAGNLASLFGASWSETNESTEMTLGEDGLYIWTASDVEFTEGTTIYFKVVADHQWGIAYPTSNYELQIPEAGVYDITITFNPETTTVDAKAERKVEPIGDDHFFVVAGTFNEWGVDATYKMEQKEAGIFTYTIANIELEANQVTEFKVVDMYDNDNLKWYPADENVTFAANEAGSYDITVTFDVYSGMVTAEGVRHIELHTYTVTWVNIEHWDEVYAYAWSYNLDNYTAKEFMGIWPGTPLELTGKKEIDGVEYEIYTCTIVDEFPPQNIIFNNGLAGDGNQTTDHAFVDGKEYSEMAPPIPVTMNDYGFMPYSSKFALMITDDLNIKAYYASDTTVEGELIMERYIGKVPARYALFLVGEPNTTVLIPTTFGVGGYSENLMTGSVENTHVTPSDEEAFRYTFMDDEKEPGFYEVTTEDCISPAGMAYIESPKQLATDENGKVILILSDIPTTGITDVQSVVEDGKVYNLNGQRIVKTVKGLYIVNGKKYVKN